MNNITKAISAALEEHSAAERHVDRWTDALSESVFNGVISHLGEKLFVTEEMRVRAATLANELAVDFVDTALPKFITKAANGAKLERTVFAAALTQELLERIAQKSISAACRALNPQIQKKVEARDRAIAAQPSGDYVQPSIDLGQFAADQQRRFAIEDARKAAPVAQAPAAFIDTDTDTTGVLAAGERTLAQGYSAHEKGPAPSAARVLDVLAKADTTLDLAGGGRYPAKKQKGRR